MDNIQYRISKLVNLKKIEPISNSSMDAATIHFIHDAAWVVLIFTLGMLVGYLLKVVMVNRERRR